MISLKRLRRKKVLRPIFCILNIFPDDEEYRGKIKKLAETKRNCWRDSKKIILD